MSRHKDKKVAGPTTKNIVDAIKTVQGMSGKRARFTLVALLVGDKVPLDAFARVCKMADHPTPIERA